MIAKSIKDIQMLKSFYKENQQDTKNWVKPKKTIQDIKCQSLTFIMKFFSHLEFKTNPKDPSISANLCFGIKN